MKAQSCRFNPPSMPNGGFPGCNVPRDTFVVTLLTSPIPQLVTARA
jgi:hypothetical protein